MPECQSDKIDSGPSTIAVRGAFLQSSRIAESKWESICALRMIGRRLPNNLVRPGTGEAFSIGRWSMDSRSAAANLLELERAELEAILSAGIFQRTSNSARFLIYVCEKHWAGAHDEITEYLIGVNALGRRPEFDTRSDSVVRVEAHRVRSKLAQYFERNPGRPVRIVIQPGQYAPEFIHRPTGSVDTLPGETIPVASASVPPRLPAKRWLPVAVAVALALAATGIFVIFRKSIVVASVSSSPLTTNPAARTTPPTALTSQSTVRIRCGSTETFLDQDGALWQPDRYYQGGETQTRPLRYIARTADPAIYTSSRQGAFEYAIPLASGVYELRLHFAEVSDPTHGDDIIINSNGENSRKFNITLNGSPLIDGLDVVSDAGGIDVADVKVFLDVSPAADGLLHLRFIEGGSSVPFVNAIEIAPGEKGKMRPLRWIARSSPIKARDGTEWHSDRYYRGGRFSYFHGLVASPVPEIYQTERFGNFDYRIPVPPGRYTVKLHFAENYHGVFDPMPGEGRRTFRVYSDSGVLLSEYDIAKSAGGPLKAVINSLHLTANAQQKIILVFEPIHDYALVNAFEVEDEGGHPSR